MDPSKHPLWKEQIRYSIVIPNRGRPDRLQNCLHSIRNLDYPKSSYEVIVVFDGDLENYQQLQTHWNQADLNLQFIFQERAGPAAARNHGTHWARGVYLAFTDDDCIIPCNWLNQADLAFKQHPECMLGGKIQAATPKDIYSVASHTLLEIVYKFYNANPRHSKFFASCHIFIPKSSFHKIGGFDPNFWTSEDRDLCARWSSLGWPMLYQPALVVQHNQKDNFLTFFRRHFGYGKGGYRFHNSQAHQNRVLFQLAPKEFYRHLFSHIFRLGRSFQDYRLVFLLLISQFASLSGFAFEAASSHFQSSPQLSSRKEEDHLIGRG